jgi:N,N'-diacetyllegionaminate synthase
MLFQWAQHFTYDKSLPGPDHKASLSPGELKAFVQEVRRVEQFLGITQKLPTLAETRTRASLQKCLVATKAIKQGEAITEDMFIAKRTGGIGISPLYYKSVIGKKALKDIALNGIIEIE